MNRVVIEPARTEFTGVVNMLLHAVTKATVGPYARLSGLGVDLGKEFVPTLMAELRSRRSSVSDGVVLVAGDQGLHGSGVLGNDGRFPGIRMVLVCVFRGVRVEGLVEHRVERGVWDCSVAVVAASLGGSSPGGLGERTAISRFCAVVVLGAASFLILGIRIAGIGGIRLKGGASELFKSQHVLGEGFGVEERAMGRIGGHIAATAVLGPATQARCEDTARRTYGRLDLPRRFANELALCEYGGCRSEGHGEYQDHAHRGLEKPYL